MNSIVELKKNIESLKDIVDTKSERLSKIVKVFSSEIRSLSKDGFTKKEQIEILSKVLKRDDIKYPNYVKLTAKYVDNKNDEKKEVSSPSDITGQSTEKVQDEKEKKPMLNLPKRKGKKSLEDDIDLSIYK